VARLVAGAELQRLPHLGHLAHEENPELIAGLILSLIPAADKHKVTQS
jgi:pimeloyl-ACP methyl ester carboxylesterase